MLILSNIDLSCLLEEPLILPPRVKFCQLLGQPVVLPHEEGVEGDQGDSVIGSDVPANEAFLPLGIREEALAVIARVLFRCLFIL